MQIFRSVGCWRIITLLQAKSPFPSRTSSRFLNYLGHEFADPGMVGLTQFTGDMQGGSVLYISCQYIIRLFFSSLSHSTLFPPLLLVCLKKSRLRSHILLLLWQPFLPRLTSHSIYPSICCPDYKSFSWVYSSSFRVLEHLQSRWFQMEMSRRT